jgi:hypothetical protein
MIPHSVYPAGRRGIPLVMHHAALCLAKPKLSVTSAVKRTAALQIQTQTHERTQTF